MRWTIYSAWPVIAGSQLRFVAAIWLDGETPPTLQMGDTFRVEAPDCDRYPGRAEAASDDQATVEICGERWLMQRVDAGMVHIAPCGAYPYEDWVIMGRAEPLKILEAASA